MSKKLPGISWLGLFFILGAVARPSLPLVESVYVRDPQARFYSELKNKKDFVIDHRKSTGFELYGPRGLSNYLDANHIRYEVMANAVDQKTLNDYPSFADLETKLKALAAQYPKLAQLSSIGQSVKGKELYFLKISKNAAIDAHLPEFKYISSMHGDEVTGRELMVSLAEELLSKYGTDPQITELVDNTEIYIMPSMNPDGTELHQRFNANNADLNRDFPDFTSDPHNTPTGRQIETAALMKFQEGRNFALSANFHGGSEVVNYPWDTTDAKHPFDQLLQELSLSYAQLVSYIFNSSEFTHGITNGFTWYEVNGGMQDWSEFYYHDLQFTIELSGTKWPSYSTIAGYYQNNRAALLQFIRNIHQGAGFYFQDPSVSGTVVVQKAGHDLATYAFNHGEFYRVLEPGAYDFVVKTADGKEYDFTEAVTANQIIPGGNYKVLGATEIKASRTFSSTTP